MPWVPMDKCEQCGSEDIMLVPDEDYDVGYHSTVWQCANGHNVEVWSPDGGWSDPK